MRLITKQHLAVCDAASADETRFVLTGVYVEETDKGCRTTATDGRILASVDDTSKSFAPEDFPAVTGLTPDGGRAKSAIVRVDDLKKAASAISKRSQLPVLETVAFVAGEGGLTLAATDLEAAAVVPTRAIDGKYPDYSVVSPKGKPALKIGLGVKYLSTVAKIAKSFGLDSVAAEFWDDKTPMRIVGEHGGRTLTIVLMPVRL